MTGLPILGADVFRAPNGGILVETDYFIVWGAIFRAEEDFAEGINLGF
jgi:hypothetical protein